MTRAYFILAFLVVWASECYSQIGAKSQTSKIYGTWVNNDFGYQMTLILNDNSQGEFDGEQIAFAIQATSLIISQNGVNNNYTFSLQGNLLTLSGGDLDAPITFNRLVTQSSNSSAHADGKFSSKLEGIWSAYNETIEFNRSGTCNYQGQSYPFTVSSEQITLQTAQGNFVMGYRLNGNQLTLLVNGQSLNYQRGTAGGPNTATTQASAGKRIDQSIVGKWCYVNITNTNSGGTSTDECITINGDGTYEYYSERSMSANTPAFSAGTSSQGSDRGTWWIEGDRIHYNSQTQGSGSYQLVKRNHPKNGDAMIILDGTPYVTYYNRSPW